MKLSDLSVGDEFSIRGSILRHGCLTSDSRESHLLLGGKLVCISRDAEIEKVYSRPFKVGDMVHGPGYPKNPYEHEILCIYEDKAFVRCRRSKNHSIYYLSGLRLVKTA